MLGFGAMQMEICKFKYGTYCKTLAGEMVVILLIISHPRITRCSGGSVAAQVMCHIEFDIFARVCYLLTEGLQALTIVSWQGGDSP